MRLLERLQCLDTRQAGHLLIKKYYIHRTLLAHVDSILPAHGRYNLVALAGQIDYVRLEEINLVVSPKDGVHNSIQKSDICIQCVHLIVAPFADDRRKVRCPRAIKMHVLACSRVNEPQSLGM